VTVTRQGGRLKLVHTPARVVELLVLSGLSDVFERFDSMKDAKDSF
jgi:anti-anti-sigma regulatory factor